MMCFVTVQGSVLQRFRKDLSPDPTTALVPLGDGARLREKVEKGELQPKEARNQLMAMLMVQIPGSTKRSAAWWPACGDDLVLTNVKEMVQFVKKYSIPFFERYPTSPTSHLDPALMTPQPPELVVPEGDTLSGAVNAVYAPRLDQYSESEREPDPNHNRTHPRNRNQVDDHGATTVQTDTVALPSGGGDDARTSMQTDREHSSTPSKESSSSSSSLSTKRSRRKRAKNQPSDVDDEKTTTPKIQLNTENIPVLNADDKNETAEMEPILGDAANHGADDGNINEDDSDKASTVCKSILIYV